MGNFFIRKVLYSGDKYFYESPDFQNGINIIEGENGNGKSTLIGLIYYTLGGGVKQFELKSKEHHEIITKDSNNFTELRIQINDEHFILRRSIGTNFITVANQNGNVSSFSLNRNENPVIFSDWFLEKLGIRILDIFQGDKKFKLNITDLFRLIYHDQNPDPRKVYKKPDNDSYVSDSEYVRKLVFRILLGKNFEKYYAILGELQFAETEKNIAQSILNEFKLISSELYKDSSEITNADHLKEEINLMNDQLVKLDRARGLLKIKRPNKNDSVWSNIESIKQELFANEVQKQQLQEELSGVNQELYKYEKYREGVIKEVTQLNKIIHTHNTLEVFNANSCPFCLNGLERKKGHCYCGNEVLEETFEKFFFSSDEYWDLLKARKKSVETVDLVIKSVSLSFNELESKLNLVSKKSDSLREELKRNLNEIDENSVDIDKLNDIDDISLKIKSEIQDLMRKMEFEEKLRKYQQKYDEKKSDFEKLKRETKILELSTSKEMDTIVDDFNDVFNRLMVETLKDCRSAKIDPDTYEPIIDEGIYREASARVSVRFNYFLTMLILSLKNDAIKFPKFLLIDTPNTAGIDIEQLNKLLGQFLSISANNFQVIMTTGLGTYPNQLKSMVRSTLSDENKLLQKRKY